MKIQLNKTEDTPCR